jgi:hypothetical protein
MVISMMYKLILYNVVSNLCTQFPLAHILTTLNLLKILHCSRVSSCYKNDVDLYISMSPYRISCCSLVSPINRRHIHRLHISSMCLFSVLKKEITVPRSLTQCSSLKVNWRFGEICYLRLHSRISWTRYQRRNHLACHLLSYWYLARFIRPWTWRWCVLSVEFQWTAWHYIQVDSTLHNHCCESLESYIQYFDFSPSFLKA